MDKLRIYAQLSNMMLWKGNHQGIDPEYYNLPSGPGASSGASGSGGLIGPPAAGLPDRMKPYMTFGVNVSFK
jgi:hypothetical protein